MKKFFDDEFDDDDCINRGKKKVKPRRANRLFRDVKRNYFEGD